MKSVLSVKEASTFLQMDEKTLKSGLRSGTLNIGSAIITKITNNKPRYKYHIPLKKAEEYMGISYNEFLNKGQ